MINKNCYNKYYNYLNKNNKLFLILSILISS